MSIFLIICIIIGVIALIARLLANSFSSPYGQDTNDFPQRGYIREYHDSSQPLQDHDVAVQARRDADAAKVKQMRKIQTLQLRTPWTAEDLGCNLLIGVDANPTKMGGYAVHLRNETKGVEMYTFKTDKLPWELHDKSRMGSSEEFEMKNLLFSLLLWQEEIEAAETFCIYTDNAAINSNSLYGRRARGFVAHLENCRGALLCNPNENMHVNRLKHVEDFARFIQPADDLSRWEIEEATNFLTMAYGVDVTRRTHSPVAINGYNPKTPAFKGMLKTVKNAVERWRSPCPTCNFCIEDTDSLQSIVGIN